MRLTGRTWWLGWAALVLLAGLRAVPDTASRLVPVDLIRFAQGGEQIVRFRLDQVYASDWNQGGPLEQLFALLLLPTRAARSIAGVDDWDSLLLLRVAVEVVVTGLVPFALRRLRRAGGLAPARDLELLASAAFLALHPPLLAWTAGHPAQLAVPALWMWAAAGARAGHPARAGVLVGLSAGWEPWGVLGVPVLLLAGGPRQVIAAGATAVTTTLACYVPFVLTGEFRMFDHRWPVSPVTVVHLLRPDLDGFGWTLRLGQAVGAVAAGAAVVALLRRHPDVIWAAPLAVVLGRLLLDPLMLTYYWAAPLLLVTAGIGLLGAEARPLRLAVLAVLAVVARGPGWADGYLAAPAVAGTAGIVVPLLLLGLAVLLVRPAPAALEPARPEPARPVQEVAG